MSIQANDEVTSHQFDFDVDGFPSDMLAMLQDRALVTLDEEYHRRSSSKYAYQSEADLERSLIEKLQNLGYELIHVSNSKELKANLRHQLEKLNNYTFTDSEWRDFFGQHLANKNMGIEEKTELIQVSPVISFRRENGLIQNIELIDKHNIFKNSVQVAHQYSTRDTSGSKSSNRYDVTILVNGLPLVHIELKRRGVALREAFNQINRYQDESFRGDDGLFEYVQIFVISNGTDTKYYSNSARKEILKSKQKKSKKQRSRMASESFKFASSWADKQNNKIRDLEDFTRSFFYKPTLLNMLTKYCVFTSDKSLMVLRPYQIAAVEAMLIKIVQSSFYGYKDRRVSGGYIFHSTGSGKTLTSFVASKLIGEMSLGDDDDDEIANVIFLVDRKDLDYQTIAEFSRFGCQDVRANTSTQILEQNLSTKKELLEKIQDLKRQGKPYGHIDPTRGDSNILVTTMQKMSNLLSKSGKMEIFDKRVVIIFDECHRSQFGSMHSLIRKKFKRANIFGFTGTPIFDENKVVNNPNQQTTAQVFGDMLHAYRITDAIEDGNVLRFRVDYKDVVPKMLDAEVDPDELGSQYFHSPGRIRAIAKDVLKCYPHVTVQNGARFIHHLTPEEGKKDAQTHRATRGFNAMFTCDSIAAAKLYYQEFADLQKDLGEDRRLKIAMIYSTQSQSSVEEGGIVEEDFDTSELSGSNLAALERAVTDYNEYFSTNFNVRETESFEDYYKDISRRMKNGEIDLLIVVNMFLTGFDARILNTLFIDRDLTNHGLLQAMSRTNRIYNDVKTHGNIVTYRDLDEDVKEALLLFGGPDVATSTALMKPYSHYHAQYVAKAEEVKELLQRNNGYPRGTNAKKAFCAIFRDVLRLQAVLRTFDEFDHDATLSKRESQDYLSIYNDLLAEAKAQREALDPKDEDSEDTWFEEVEFEVELMRQVDINVDYIVMLLDKYRGHVEKDDNDVKDEKAQEMIEEIKRSIKASVTLKNSLDLVEEFIATLPDDRPNEDTGVKWERFVIAKRQEELDSLIQKHNLDPESTEKEMKKWLRDNEVQ